MSTILVTDGEQRAALAVVRSLGQAGHRVVVASADLRPLAGASKFAAEVLRCPDPLADPQGFLGEIAAIVRSRGVTVVVPVTEAAHLALLANPAALAPGRLAAPTLATFRRAADKAHVLELAGAGGLAVPRQVVLAVRDGLQGNEPPSFPVVIKPSRSVGEAAAGREKLGVRHAADRHRLAEIVAQVPDAAFPLLIQERIVGPGVGVFLLRWQGRVVARFAHRRLREKPPSGGVSVLCESAAADPELTAHAERLLDALDWEGVAMVEFKLDASGRPYLMEINGRFWGSLQLAVDAGVDFPRLLVEAVLDQAPSPALQWRLGVRSRWFWGDVDCLLLRLLRSPASLSLPAGAPSRASALLQFLAWRPWRERDAVFRLRDPRPFLRESAAWVRAL